MVEINRIVSCLCDLTQEGIFFIETSQNSWESRVLRKFLKF